MPVAKGENAYDVIVVGGGVAGLAAAGRLARSGFTVAVLEARERLGGRIHTVKPPHWNQSIELGAEFVHAGNAALWRLLKNHRLRATRVPAHHWLADERGVREVDDITERIENVTSLIQPRRMRGWSFADFVAEKKNEIAAEELELAAGFIEGFQAAPKEKMSASAVAGETLDVTEQFHLPKGYAEVVHALVAAWPENHVAVFPGTVVQKVRWRRGAVVVSAGPRRFSARAVVLTVPLGVLQAKATQSGAIAFTPMLRAKQRLVAKMEMGHAIRILLRFKAREWKRIVTPRLTPRKKGGFGFVHAPGTDVQVWWSLTRQPVLTGWAGGPAAKSLGAHSERIIYHRAVAALASALRVSQNVLRRAVADWRTYNWTSDPFSRGAYSFIAAGQDDASARLGKPVQGTLFFAGEATADGEEIGTVHGALASGLRAAKEVRGTLKKVRRRH